ncbi:phosphotransferase [uncultured Paracoccus sp.]|uniref:phosphotransferase enzyme family protein n=1 Tax=uncultured Paracoccus sp. TaxID=189685 RepID=UPI002592C1F0|nr:phosphotransferase [uncultured Paracoccus sp.]
MNDFLTRPVEDQIATVTRIAKAALPLWGLDGADLTLIKYRENGVFRVDAPSGLRAVLRVHRIDYHSDAELRSELQWMDALGCIPLLVPRVRPALDGRLMIRFSLSDTPEFQIDVLDWLDGVPVGSAGEDADRPVEEMKQIYLKAGEIAGALHNHSQSWQRPEGFVRHAWDRDGLIGPAPFWGEFRSLPALAPHLPLIDAAIRQAHADLDDLGTSGSVYGLIHADLVPDNLLQVGEGLALIDFDDAGYGYYLFELATAVYFHFGTDIFEDVLASMIAGYRSVRPIDDQELQYFDLFLALRGMTYLGWVSTRSETQTAKEMLPLFIELSVASCKRYLDGRKQLASGIGGKQPV